MKLLITALPFLFFLFCYLPSESLKNSVFRVEKHTVLPSMAGDSMILAILYDELGGNEWTNRENWFASNRLDDWYGISADENNRVTSVELGSNNLTGTIPDVIGDLTMLVRLDLDTNNITGVIPPSIGQLGNLEFLSLVQNDLQGSIPPSLGNLSKLNYLAFGENNLSGEIPNTLGNLTALTDLWLYRNNFSGNIPVELGSLSNLKNLSLAENGLTGSIPEQLGNLNDIETLWLNANNLTGVIPTSLGSLENLTNIDLCCNNIEGQIPESFGSLISLQNLWLAANNISGNIPSVLGNLSNLLILDISYNHLIGELPESIGNLNSLNHIYLHSNNLVGCFPESYDLFCSLGFSENTQQQGYNFTLNAGLTLQGDFERVCDGVDQTGLSCDDGNSNTENDIITERCECMGIEILDTTSCRYQDSLMLTRIHAAFHQGNEWTVEWDLTTPIDTWQGVFLNEDGCVEAIDLPSNNLTGELIDMDFPELVFLNLGRNNIQGSLIDFEGLPSLERLILLDNSLRGNIPDFRFLPRLSELSLGNNELTGAIPNFTNMPNLELLWLDNNNLTLLPELTNVDRLEVLFCHSNNISSELPSFRELPNLNRLDIHDNEITGNIPELHTTCPQLTKIYLYNNYLSGCFPDELIEFCGLGFSTLISNDGYNFTGNLMLPWQGDFERFCNGENQIGATCDDGNVDTENDIIGEDCGCLGINISCRFVDSLELVLFHDRMNGLEWTRPWNLNEPLENWEGIVLSDEGCVEEINLAENNLRGELYQLNFEHLTRLSLGLNNILGQIPDFINLPELSVLLLGYNNLDGVIPDFSGIPNLFTLHLQNNQLSGSIPDFSNIPRLRQFNCFSNELTGNIPDFTNLPQLTSFSCSDNNLTGSIPNFSNLPNLAVFSCSRNDLEGNIPDFSNLPALRSFDCSRNNLSGTIPDFSNLPNLEDFICFENNLIGSVPDLSDNCPGLMKIHMDNNNLSGCFPEGMRFFCGLGHAPFSDRDGYNFDDNEQLPWSGDFERFCNGEPQIGAVCNDQDDLTEDDVILEDCTCEGTPILTCEDIRVDTLIYICQGEIFNLGPINANSSGIYNYTFISQGQCDSSVRVDLRVISNSSSELSTQICEGESYNFNGLVLDQTGIYLDTLANSNGCDSIMELRLNVVSITNSTINEIICFGSSYEFNGRSLNETGVYQDTIKSTNGCDSVLVTLNLNVVPPILTEITNTICQGERIEFNNQSISLSGIYYDTLNSINNCDSIIQLELTVLEGITELVNEEICFGEIYEFGGGMLSNSGTYQDTMEAVNGCDSIITLNLTVRSQIVTEVRETICEDEQIEFNDQSLFASGVYSDTLTSLNDCDSIVNLYLTVLESTRGFIEANLCQGESYPFGDTILTDSGIYTDTIPNALGCDSIIQLNLEVFPRQETLLNGFI